MLRYMDNLTLLCQALGHLSMSVVMWAVCLFRTVTHKCSGSLTFSGIDHRFIGLKDTMILKIECVHTIGSGTNLTIST